MPGTLAAGLPGGDPLAGSVTGSGNTATGRVYESVSQYGVLDAELRIGTYKRQFHAAVEGWNKLAKQISKDVSVWLLANRERIQSR